MDKQEETAQSFFEEACAALASAVRDIQEGREVVVRKRISEEPSRANQTDNGHPSIQTDKTDERHEQPPRPEGRVRGTER